MADEPRTRSERAQTKNLNIQLYTLMVHGAILFALIGATTYLTATGHFTADAAIGVFGSIAGFSGSAAAYRAGVRHADVNNT